MPDVGVLNLQIKSDSSQAAQGLKNLAGALERVRSAVNKSGLNSVSGALQRINKAINGFRLDGTIENLNGVASALKRIKEASDFTLPNLKGAGNFKKAADEANKSAEAVKKAKEAVQNASKNTIAEGSTGFTDMASEIDRVRESVDTLNQSLERTASLMQNLGWSNGQTQAGAFGTAFNAFSDARSGRALMDGHGFLGAGQTAIPAEGWVSGDVAEGMRQQALPAAEDIDNEVKSITSYSENIESRWNAIAAKWAEAERLGRQMAETMRQQSIADSIAKSQRIARPMAEKYNNTEPYARRREMQQRVWELRNALNQNTADISADGINRSMGMNNGVKSAEDSMRVFMEQMGGGTELGERLKVDNPELDQFKQTLENAGISAHEFNSRLVDVDGELKSKKKDAGEAGNAFKQFKNSTDEASSASNRFKHATTAVGQVLGRIGRIFQTMLIRSALKAMIKSFRESWEAMYNFSQATNGTFAASLDKMRGLMSASATNILKTFAPAIEALLPVVNVVASAIQYLCSMIQSLLSLLGMSSEFWGKSADSINKYSKAAGAGGSKTQDMLAKFDELNVISKDSGGGGGGGAGGLQFGGISDIVSDEMAKLQLIVGESLLAIGLILACTGHIPLGVGMMAIGAAAIVKTLVNDWGGLSEKVKGEIATIMAVIGVSAMAVGAILAVFGHPAIGIGLMAIGAANLFGVAYVNTQGGIADEVRAQITTITSIVGGALLAVGAVLAFSGANVPLGIGLMIAGAASLATAVALNWNSISGFIQQNIDKILKIVGFASLAIGAILAFSGVNIPLGIGLIAAGAASLITSVAMNWNSVSSTVQQKVNNLLKIVGGASLVVGAILAFSGVNIPLGIGLMAAGGIALISGFGDVNWESLGETIKGVFKSVGDFLVGVWDSVKQAAADAWDGVKKWWEDSGIGPAVRNAWSSIKTFFSQLWNGIKQKASAAWLNVKQWWESSTLGEKIESAWNGVKTFLTGVWNGVKNAARNAWDKVKDWWEKTDLKTKVENAWKNVKDYLAGVWSSVQTAANFAWNKVKTWWETHVQANMEKEGIWGGVKGFFQGIFGESGIGGWVSSAWESISKWWQDGIGKWIEGAWAGVKDFFNGLLEPIRAIGQWIHDIFHPDTTRIEYEVYVNEEHAVHTTTISSNAGVTSSSRTNKAGGGTRSVTDLFYADGGYDIPRGDLFIANEEGAEFIGSINGKTSVANQQQIVDGISKGVADANADQNRLLREQNDLLRRILAKEYSVNLGSKAQFGRTVRQSLDAYESMVGG